MKKILSLAIVASAILYSCAAYQKTILNARREYVSWTSFCATHGYDANNQTFEVTNEYLDTWCGSAAEEQAFIKAGIKPY